MKNTSSGFIGYEKSIFTKESFDNSYYRNIDGIFDINDTSTITPRIVNYSIDDRTVVLPTATSGQTYVIFCSGDDSGLTSPSGFTSVANYFTDVKYPIGCFIKVTDGTDSGNTVTVSINDVNSLCLVLNKPVRYLAGTGSNIESSGPLSVNLIAPPSNALTFLLCGSGSGDSQVVDYSSVTNPNFDYLMRSRFTGSNPALDVWYKAFQNTPITQTSILSDPLDNDRGGIMLSFY
jgi:hypothetical protein